MRSVNNRKVHHWNAVTVWVPREGSWILVWAYAEVTWKPGHSYVELAEQPSCGMSREEARLTWKQVQACHPSGHIGAKQESNRFSIPFKSQEPVNSAAAKSLCIYRDDFQGIQRDRLLCTWEFQGVCEGVFSCAGCGMRRWIWSTLQVDRFPLSPFLAGEGLGEAPLLGLQGSSPEFRLPVE